jgi:hypothetical protein
MVTIRARSTAVWEVHLFVGADAHDLVGAAASLAATPAGVLDDMP